MKINKPVLIGAAFLIVALVGGGFYLYKTNPDFAAKVNPSGSIKMVPRVSENDFQDIQDKDIRKHLVAQINQPAYRVKSTSSGRGEGYTITEANIGSDFAFRTVEHDGTKEVTDMIIIGDMTYVKDYSDNSWWRQNTKETVPESERYTMPDLEKLADPVEEIQKKKAASFTKGGQEPCGSLTCFKYEEKMEENPEATRTFWFDTKDYLLRKETFGFGEFLSTNEYSYNAQKITVPSPTKDVPEGQSIYMYLTGQSSQMPEGMGEVSEEQRVESEKLREELGTPEDFKNKSPEELKQMLKQYGENVQNSQ